MGYAWSRVAAAALLAIAAPAIAETLTNDSVIALLKAGVGDEAVVAKIRTSDSAYELSTDRVVALRQAGVSSAVIAAMINAGAAKEQAGKSAFDNASADPAVPHAPGFYLLQAAGTPAMARIDPTTSNQTKTGGILGYAFTGGLASLSVKAVIPGAHAQVVTQTATPRFYLFVDAAAPSMFASGLGNTVTPNEFTLVRLREKSGRREARVGSMNIGGAKAGVMDKDRLPFTYKLVRPGAYQVDLPGALEPGEYAFLYSVSAGSGIGITSGGAMASRVFDFSIPAPAPRPTTSARR